MRTLKYILTDARTHVAILATPFIVAFVVVGCGGGGAPKDTSNASDVSVYHDTQRSVTCWILDRYRTSGYVGGISCISDSGTTR